MENENINTLFKDLEGQFDIESPNSGHEERFLNKLENSSKVVNINRKRNIWKPFTAVAASIVLMISVFTFTQNSNTVSDLASVSPEMATTQEFFTNTIASELEKIDEVKSPETQIIVDDAILQISFLEEQYQKLKIDLSESGNDNRVIFAMISNFQSRIEILQSVIEQIENLKQLKNDNNENSIEI
ncbi:MAG: hypothetical protein HKO92_04530 [Flavobacteriaceae bacterium]|nr:hypothetical protein [Flavobacteriaceae bacterium]